MRIFKRYRCHLVLLLLLGVALISASCAGRSHHKSIDEDGYSNSVTLHLDKMESLLERGKEARLEGAYQKAEEHFKEVYDNNQASMKQRAEALFELGSVFADLRNPNKSYRQAIGYFEKLLKEFPKSPLVDRTKKRIKEAFKFSK